MVLKVHDPFATGKVQLSMAGSSQVSTLSDSAVVPAGAHLGVLIDDSCLSDEGRSRLGALARQINLAGSRPSSSGKQAFSWSPKTDLRLSALKQLADADECVIGVGDDGIETIVPLEGDGLEESDVAAMALPTAGIMMTPNDPMYARQGHLKMIEAATAYDTFYGTRGITRTAVIAVIDTGIDLKHPDLKNRLWTNPGEIPGNGKDDDANGFIDDYNGYNFAAKIGSPAIQGTWSGSHHGTHVAGLAAAQAFNEIGVTGVMGRSAQIMMLNAFGSSSGASRTNITNAIRYAADNGAHVINLSLGGVGESSLYRSAIAYALSKGVAIFAAAGNSSAQISTSYFASPAGYAREFSGMLAIGSVDSSTLKASRFTNYGPTYVELAAPGAEDSYSYLGLLSTMPSAKYARISGTSMATPVAAASAALASAMLRTRGYGASPARLESILRNSARKVGALTAYFYEGNVLNLRNVAGYITRNYPDLRRAPDPTPPESPAPATPTATPVPKTNEGGFGTDPGSSQGPSDPNSPPC